LPIRNRLTNRANLLADVKRSSATNYRRSNCNMMDTQNCADDQRSRASELNRIP
jgi:hypothetical protein